MQTIRRCYYPEIPGHLASIVADDQRVAQRADCANAGCSFPVEYVCCDDEAAIQGEATYQVSVSNTAVDRVQISRTGADGRCSAISFISPSAMVNAFRIQTPGSSWPVEGARESGCAQDAARDAIGGFGQVRWHGDPCVLEFDFTLFFPPEPGAPAAVKFKATGLPLSDGGALRCE